MVGKNTKFPRWAAPLVGMGAGVVMFARGAGQPLSWEWLVGGAGVGLLAGGLIWLLDRPPAPAGSVDAPGEESGGGVGLEGEGRGQSGVIGRFLALVSVGFFWTPGVGLILGIAALLTNLRTRDWTRKCSKVGLGLSVAASIAWVILVSIAGDGH